jgi:hypothetical protein
VYIKDVFEITLDLAGEETELACDRVVQRGFKEDRIRRQCELSKDVTLLVDVVSDMFLDQVS